MSLKKLVPGGKNTFSNYKGIFDPMVRILHLMMSTFDLTMRIFDPMMRIFVSLRVKRLLLSVIYDSPFNHGIDLF